MSMKCSNTIQKTRKNKHTYSVLAYIFAGRAPVLYTEGN